MDILKELEKINKKCTGCRVCANMCPVNSISMKNNPQGFYYPETDLVKCINCNLCYNSCPKIKKDESNSDKPTCYAARSSDEVRFESSSGGMFTLVAEWILNQGGVVCGAVMDDDYNVYHKFVDNVEDLNDLKKSKYVQSDTRNVYKELLNYLKKGKKVLFTGTPCQVAAAKNCVGKNRDNVYFIDILCHGVPSNQMWKDYINENYNKDEIKTIEFRSKLNGWRSEQLRIFWKNGTSSRVEWHESMYIEGFQRNISLRDGCEDCEFAGSIRQGDLSIGDFWRVEEYDPYLNDKKGTSVVLVNNEIGKYILDEIKPRLLDLQETPIKAARFNRLKEKLTPHPQKDRFETLYPSVKNYSDAIWQCRHNLFDIGLVGIYTVRNYGAHLTYYALYETLTAMGYTVLMINCPKNARLKTKDNPELFEVNPYPRWAQSRRFENISEMKFLNLQTNVFVVGSDQMFNNLLYNDFAQFQTLNFVSDNNKKIAYAASFGHDKIWGPEGDRATESYFIKKFDHFSVREDSAIKLLEDEFGFYGATHVLDPVFTMSRDKYDNLVSIGRKNIPNEKYLFAYILDPDPKKEEVLKTIASRKGLGLRTITDAFDSISGKNRYQWDIDTLEKQSIESWIAHIAMADYIIADSFHGVCLSIIFHKPFIAVVNKMRGEARFTSLLKLLNLEDRAIYDFDDINDEMVDKIIDYDKVENKLIKLRESSLSWLKSAIDSNPKTKKSFSTFDVVDSRIDELWERTDVRYDGINQLLNKQLADIDDINRRFNDSINEINNRLDQEIRKKNIELESVYNSTSFRIGRIITWLPRMIKKFFKLK